MSELSFAERRRMIRERQEGMVSAQAVTQTATVLEANPSQSEAVGETPAVEAPVLNSEQQPAIDIHSADTAQIPVIDDEMIRDREAAAARKAAHESRANEFTAAINSPEDTPKPGETKDKKLITRRRAMVGGLALLTGMGLIGGPILNDARVNMTGGKSFPRSAVAVLNHEDKVGEIKESTGRVFGWGVDFVKDSTSKITGDDESQEEGN